MKQIGACLLGKLYDEVGSSPALAISLAQSYFDGVLYDDAVRCEQRYTGICEWCLWKAIAHRAEYKLLGRGCQAGKSKQERQ